MDVSRIFSCVLQSFAPAEFPAFALLGLAFECCVKVYRRVWCIEGTGEAPEYASESHPRAQCPVDDHSRDRDSLGRESCGTRTQSARLWRSLTEVQSVVLDEIEVRLRRRIERFKRLERALSSMVLKRLKRAKRLPSRGPGNWCKCTRRNCLVRPNKWTHRYLCRRERTYLDSKSLGSWKYKDSLQEALQIPVTNRRVFPVNKHNSPMHTRSQRILPDIKRRKSDLNHLAVTEKSGKSSVGKPGRRISMKFENDISTNTENERSRFLESKSGSKLANDEGGRTLLVVNKQTQTLPLDYDDVQKTREETLQSDIEQILEIMKQLDTTRK